MKHKSFSKYQNLVYAQEALEENEWRSKVKDVLFNLHC